MEKNTVNTQNMKKNILGIILILHAFCIHAQLPDVDKQSVISILKTGRLSPDQVIQLQRQWNSKDNFKFKADTATGEINISDILSIPDLDKKIIFRRCLEWIAINFGNLVHSELESGKIIATGLIDIEHYTGYQSGFGVMRVSQVQTPTNYTMILTIKDNKIKYIITNITYNFKNFSETIDEISYPIATIYQYKALDQNWIRFFTVLNSSSDMFDSGLKNSLFKYVNEAENDYKF